jgi:hypothetical protein
MNNLPTITENDTVPSELIDDKFYIKKYDDSNRQLLKRQSDFQYNIRQYNRDVAYLENSIDRYWNAQDDYLHIENEIRVYVVQENGRTGISSIF